MKRQSIHFIVLFLYSNYTVRYQISASKENSPYHHKNFCFFLKPNSFLIDEISCQGVKKLASTRKKTKFLVVISLRMQVFPITTIRFKNPAKISRFVYPTHSLLTHAQTNVPSVNVCKKPQQVGNSREHAQNPCGLSGLIELEGKMAEFYVTE